jgi:putative membrane protein
MNPIIIFLSMSGSETPPNPTNELAKERTRAAAERTLSAWINNCLVLIGFGITIDRVYPGMEAIWFRSSSQASARLIHITGLSFMGFGIGLLLTVMVQHLLILQSLEQPSGPLKGALFLRLNQVKIATVLIFGVLGLLIIFFRSSPVSHGLSLG